MDEKQAAPTCLLRVTVLPEALADLAQVTGPLAALSIDLFRSSSASIWDQGKKPAGRNICSFKRWFSGGTLRIHFPSKRKENF